MGRPHCTMDEAQLCASFLVPPATMPDEGGGLTDRASCMIHEYAMLFSLHSSYLALAIDADGVARERCCLYVVCWQRMKHLR